MANPSYKSEEMESSLVELTGVDRRDLITANKCTWCGGDAEKFRNIISAREYRISGFCQSCQDDTFGPD